MPYFSVILPIYNVAPYLPRCIESILEQDFKDYEIILVDDGSTDESAQMCDMYAGQHQNIRVIHKENGGLSSARNAGFDMAEGRYIWWVDSDDWIEKGALAELHRVSCKDHPDVIKFNYYSVNNKKRMISCEAAPGLYTDEKDISLLVEMALYTTRRFPLSAWGHAYSRCFLEETGIRFVSERLVCSEDYLFNLSVLPRASSVYILSAPLYDYRLREGSLSQRYRVNLMTRYEKLYFLLQKEYQQTEGLERFRAGCGFFFAFHLVKGTIMYNEYCADAAHSIKEARSNVREILHSAVLQSTLRCCDMKKLTGKQKMMLFAMEWKLESLFYWLFVVKPRMVRHK